MILATLAGAVFVFIFVPVVFATLAGAVFVFIFVPIILATLAGAIFVFIFVPVVFATLAGIFVNLLHAALDRVVWNRSGSRRYAMRLFLFIVNRAVRIARRNNFDIYCYRIQAPIYLHVNDDVLVHRSKFFIGFICAVVSGVRGMYSNREEFKFKSLLG